MNLTFSRPAEKDYRNLPQNIQNKADKQFAFLLISYRHPSLHARKKSGSGVFEARIDIHYRFTFMVKRDEIYVLTVGQHDKGLGKK